MSSDDAGGDTEAGRSMQLEAWRLQEPDDTDPKIILSLKNHDRS